VDGIRGLEEGQDSYDRQQKCFYLTVLFKDTKHSTEEAAATVEMGYLAKIQFPVAVHHVHAQLTKVHMARSHGTPSHFWP
jgi:hypothetical protein